LLSRGHELRLLIHRKNVSGDLRGDPRVEVRRADLSHRASLSGTCDGIDCIVHLAGVLFRPHPERFLEETNVNFVRNIVAVAREVGVGRFILISFPHVEGETTPDRPARGELDARPNSVHGRTRLAAERVVADSPDASGMEPVILRAAVIYGKDLKLIEAARRLLRWRLLAIWRQPTWVHLLALPDFLRMVEIACEKPGLRGVYNLADEAPMLLQEFLDRLADHWGCPRPWRLPRWMFPTAAAICEGCASLVRSATPLHRDLMKMGLTSSVADATRMKRELSAHLEFPTLTQGLALL
jgi:nucleoside-diphosphate-sugar epimerase